MEFSLFSKALNAYLMAFSKVKLSKAFKSFMKHESVQNFKSW